jgi:hypothetical protein
MRSALWALVLAASALAGCASEPRPSATELSFDDLGVVATSTTGILRGVVVDEAIRPLAGVAITALGSGQTERSATTTDSGLFAFDGLAPGTYFVRANRAGYLPVQQSTEVVAGVSDPPIVKMLMAVDSSFVAPYVEAYVLDGFIECGITTPAVAFAACSAANLPSEILCEETGVCPGNVTTDVFNQFIAVGVVPAHIQHELVWEATQSTGDMFRLAMRTATEEQFNGGSYEAGVGSALGTSPLLGTINRTVIEDAEIGLNGTGLAPAVFAGGMDGTQVCVTICLFATGATVNQKFSLYTHIFIGYVPTEGWRFSSGEPVPTPPPT